jgi:hypothetical protein
MKKRIASLFAFTLLLLFALVFSTYYSVESKENETIRQPRALGPVKVTAPSDPAEQQPYRPPSSAHRPLPEKRLVDDMPARIPRVSALDTEICYRFFDYVDWDNFMGDVTYVDMYGDSGMACAVRYDIPPCDTAIITAMSFWLAESSANSVGCDIEVGVWLDASGHPSTLIHADTIPAESLGHPVAWPGGYVAHTFSNPVLIESNEAFHISWGPTINSPDEDYVRCLFARATQNQPFYRVSIRRSSFRDPTVSIWANNMDYWSGVDSDNLQDVSYCVYCTEIPCCYHADPIPHPNNAWAWPMPETTLWDAGCIWNGVAQRFVSHCDDTLFYVSFYHYDHGTQDYPEHGSDVIIEIWADDGAGNIDLSGGPIAANTIPGRRDTLFPNTGGDGSTSGWNRVDVDFRQLNLALHGAWHVSARMSYNDPDSGVLHMPLSYEDPDEVLHYTDGVGASVNFSSCGQPWERMATHPQWRAALPDLDEMSYYIRPYLCPTSANRPPAFDECPDDTLYVEAGQWVYTTVHATDPDGDQVSYSKIFGPGDVNDSTGLYSYCPSSADAGYHSVLIVASDGQGGADLCEFWICVTLPGEQSVRIVPTTGFFDDAGTLKIRAGAQSVEWRFRIINDPSGAEDGCFYNAGFNYQVYSPDGATWGSLDFDTLPIGWRHVGDLFPGMFDSFIFNTFSGSSGSGADSVAMVCIFGGTSSASGLYDGLDTVGQRITIGPIPSADVGKHICLDTLGFNGPAGYEWCWPGFQGCADVIPGWLYEDGSPIPVGGACYEIFAEPDLPPVHDAGSFSLSGCHGDPICESYQYHDPDPENDPVTFAVTNGVGSFAGSQFCYAGTMGDVGASVIAIFDACEPDMACTTDTISITVTNTAPTITNCPSELWVNIGQPRAYTFLYEDTCHPDDPVYFFIDSTTCVGSRTIYNTGYFSFTMEGPPYSCEFRIGVTDAVDTSYCEFDVVVPPGCGVHTGGYTGNTNCDTEGKRNLADITRLIDRVYVDPPPDGPELCCEPNGNTNGDPEGIINLTDITRLVDHVYVSHEETATCP